MELAPRQQEEEEVGARLAPIARGMAIPATRPFRRVVRGAVVGSIDRFHHLVVGVVDVAIRGLRNEVVDEMDTTLGLPREGIRVAGPDPVNEVAPIAVVAGVGNDVARAERPQLGFVKVLFLRLIACVLLVSAGAFGQATWGVTCARECVGASAPGRGGAGEMVVPIEAHNKRMIDIRDDAVPDLPKGQVTAGDDKKNRVISFFDRVFKTKPLKMADVKKHPDLKADHDEGNRPAATDDKGTPTRGVFIVFRDFVRRVNAWRDDSAEMAESFLLGPWVD